MPSTRKSPRKNLGMWPNFYGTDGDQDHVEITRGKVRAKQPSKKKTPRGYKKPRKQLQAPARKISSKSSSESSEYDKESESDDDKKGLLIDISRKGWKMAVTSSNRGRREWKINDDDDIDDDNTKKSSPGLAITLQ
jgi:hypothetical protein